MVAAEAAAAGVPPVVADHSGLAEVAAGIAREYPPGLAHLTAFPTGDAAALRQRIAELLALPPEGRRDLGLAARRAVERNWSWARIAERLADLGFRPMGDEQKVGYEELLAQSRASFEEVPDFTLAVEEEFALLDPATLGLVNRFEELQAAAKGTDLEPHLVGELIASEVEVRTGRCDSFAEAAERIGERRVQLRALADGLGLGLSAVGTHPWSPWQEQRIIDTPHYRRNDELLRYVVWRNNTFGLHVHVGVNGADRAIRVASALRNYLPELLALSASSPFVEGVVHVPALGTHADLHAHVPALRHPGRLRRLGRVGALRPLPLRDRLDHRAHAGLVERPAAPRLPDRRDPHLRRAAGRRRGAVARGADLLRSSRGSRARSTRASRCRRGRTGCWRRTSGARSATGSPAS